MRARDEALVQVAGALTTLGLAVRGLYYGGEQLLSTEMQTALAGTIEAAQKAVVSAEEPRDAPCDKEKALARIANRATARLDKFTRARYDEQTEQLLMTLTNIQEIAAIALRAESHDDGRYIDFGQRET